LVSRLQEFAARHLGRPGVGPGDLGRPGVGPGDISICDGVVHVHGEPTELRWEKLVAAAQWARIDLSSHDFYATPDVYHDQTVERGRPFAYYSYGTSVTEVLLDCVRGTYAVEAVDLVHDAGRPLSETIDRGQIEGGLLQGIGWATLEQLRTGPDGRLRTTVNSYKIPDIKFGPAHVGITLLANSDNPYAVCNSKAIGEPPFIHGIGAYLALLDALRAVRQDRPFPSLPLTPERVLMALHGPAEDESTSQGR